MYEAIEAGAIPVLSLEGLAPGTYLPQAYYDSPMLVVDRWGDLWKHIDPLLDDLAALDQRQKELQQWYKVYLKQQVRQLEDVAVGHGFD